MCIDNVLLLQHALTHYDWNGYGNISRRATGHDVNIAYGIYMVKGVVNAFAHWGVGVSFFFHLSNKLFYNLEVLKNVATFYHSSNIWI